MIAPRPSGETASRGRGPARVVGLLVLLALLGCDRVDPDLREACIAVLPGLEEGDGPIFVRAASPVSGHARAIRLLWRSGAERVAHRHETVCVFADGSADASGPTLIGVHTEQGALPLARLFVLRRFWLAEAGLRTAGLERVTRAEDLR